MLHRPSSQLITGSARDYADRIGVFWPIGSNQCVNLVGGNPTINIDPNYVDVSTIHQLDLTSYNVIPLSNDNGASPGSTGGGVLQLLEDINDPAASCDTLPSPLDNDYRDATDQETGMISGQVKHDNWGESTIFNLDAPIFGLLPGGGVAIFDPYLLLQENTLASPIEDGGGRVTLESATKAGDERNFTLVRRENLDGDYQNDAYSSSFKVTDGQLSGEEQGKFEAMSLYLYIYISSSLVPRY